MNISASHPVRKTFLIFLFTLLLVQSSSALAQDTPDNSGVFSHESQITADDPTPTPEEGTAGGMAATDDTAPESPTPEPTETPLVEQPLDETPTMEPEEPAPPESTDNEGFIEPPGFSWVFQFDAVSDSQLDQAETVRSRLQAAGLSAEIEPAGRNRNSLIVRGDRSVKEIRTLFYEQLKGEISLTGGAAEVIIRMPLDTTRLVSIDLESNLSTGYRWLLVQAEVDGEEVAVSEDFNFRKGVGNPDKQTFTIEPHKAGAATFHLVYRRVFEPQETINRHLTIQFAGAAGSVDLSDPTPVVWNDADSDPGSGGLPAVDDEPLRGDLPSSLDWRDSGIVPAVRDQGFCGSCWAFGTVGIMESALSSLLEISPPDLSEQFLVSCNKDGWGCDGGLTAHKYHYNMLAKNQGTVGAVLESDMPYTTSDSSCPSIPNHPYLLYDWQYIGLGEYDTPDDEDIKAAIYDHGPVTVALCAGSVFQDYTGGVFSTDENCGGFGNHQIILVGWDDNDGNGVWILRNSWSDKWGESGYMRIEYGTSGVGEGASWVEAASPNPGQVELQSPANKDYVNDNTPLLTWTGDTNSAEYNIQISSDKRFLNIVQDFNSSDTGVSAGLLADGKYYWRVRGLSNNSAPGSWSEIWYFVVDTVPPDVPLLKSPADGSSIVGTPTFSWKRPKNAVAYQFEYGDSDNVDSYIHRSDVIIKTTKYTPPAMATMTPFYWFVRAQDQAGNWSDWSPAFTLMVVPPLPGSPTLLSPANKSAANDPTPTFDWLAVNYDDGGYELVVDEDKTFGSPEIHTFTISGETEYTPSLEMPDGKYYWAVRAKNENEEWGKWSKTAFFEVDTVPPEAPLLRSPESESEVVGTPVFRWGKVKDAVVYQFEYNDEDDPGSYLYLSGEILKKTRFSPPVMEVMTPFYWYVRARDAAGNWGAWSDPFIVTVLPPVPAAPLLLSPEQEFGTIDTSVTVAWEAVDYADKYQLEVDDALGFPSPEFKLDIEGGETSYTVEPLSGGKWNWRVRAVNQNLESGQWSTDGKFNVYDTFDTQFNTDHDSENWVRHPGEGWMVQDGYYYNIGLENFYTSSASYDSSNFFDFTYEAHMRMEAPGPGFFNEYGLVFRGTPSFDSLNNWNHGYYFSIRQENSSENGQMSCVNVKRINNGRSKYLNNAWICYESPFDFGGFNTLKVVTKGSKLEFYVNDYLLISKTNSGPTMGRLGVYSYGDFGHNYITEVDWAAAGPPVLSSAVRTPGIPEAVGYLLFDADTPSDQWSETPPIFIPVE